MVEVQVSFGTSMAFVWYAMLGENEAELTPLNFFPALARKIDLGLSSPSDLDTQLRIQPYFLIIHKDGSTEETPLHEWAKNPLPLSQVSGSYWLDIPNIQPASGNYVFYKFFNKDGELILTERVHTKTPTNVERPKGTQHLIISWDAREDGYFGVSFYFKEGANGLEDL